MSHPDLEEPYRLGNVPDGLASGEAKILAQMIVSVEKRHSAWQQELPEMLRDAVTAAMGEHLTDDERRWVRDAILAQASAKALRKAVIEKTVTGLAWALVLGLGILIREWFVSHFGKTS